MRLWFDGQRILGVTTIELFQPYDSIHAVPHLRSNVGASTFTQFDGVVTTKFPSAKVCSLHGALAACSASDLKAASLTA